jgi:hypothetical protein
MLVGGANLGFSARCINDVQAARKQGFWEKVQDWLAVDAVPCELFSGPNSLLIGKNTGNLRLYSERFGDNFTMQSGLAKKMRSSIPIGTGNDQGINREWNSLLAKSCGEMSLGANGLDRPRK